MPRSAALPWALVALALSLAPARADEPEAPPAWKKTCSLCHGKGGRPNESLARKGVRDLTDPEWQAATSDAAIAETIRKGRPGTLMGAYENRLSAEEIDGLVRFVRTLGAREPEPEGGTKP